MPTSPLQRQSNDLAVRQKAPQNSKDARVPLAEEFALDGDITIALFRGIRPDAGWLVNPLFAITNPRKLAVTNGLAVLPIYPGQLSINTTLDLPPLPSTNNLVRQIDNLYLVGFSCEVGAAQDPPLGQVSFDYRDQVTQNIQSIQKENARRVRAFWILVYSTDVLTTDMFKAALTGQDDGSRWLAVANLTDTGFVLGGLRFYAKDPNLANLVSYAVEQDSIDILPICQVKRIQRYREAGYTWGPGGEEPLNVKYTISRAGNHLTKSDLDDAIWQRSLEIFSGRPGPGTFYNRTVRNFTSGPVAGNPNADGDAAGAPNNSVCLGNDQRVTFSNQAILQTTAVTVIGTAGNDGSGNALLASSLNTSVPEGTYFSENKLNHKVYDLNGNEISPFGIFQNLGGIGALIWRAGANSPIKPGQRAFMVPAVRYPAGSGFSQPYEQVEKVWVDGVPLANNNILFGGSIDLTTYQEPANSEDYMVVTTPERCGILYIYKKVIVTSDSNGTLVIPFVEKGCFAFIETVTGRIDAPVYRGLQPSTTYKALVYYPPRTLESWQFQLSYVDYQGTGRDEADFLNGAKVLSRPHFFTHTQGGGLSVYMGDAAVRYAAIAMHLPSATGVAPPYVMDAPIHLVGESYPGPTTFRPLPAQSGAGLALPVPGQTLTTVANTGIQTRSLNLKVLIGEGQPLGFRTPLLNPRPGSTDRPIFQSVLVFVAEKGRERRLVIVTRNGRGGENVAVDSAAQVGIDLFRF